MRAVMWWHTNCPGGLQDRKKTGHPLPLPCPLARDGVSNKDGNTISFVLGIAIFTRALWRVGGQAWLSWVKFGMDANHIHNNQEGYTVGGMTVTNLILIWTSELTHIVWEMEGMEIKCFCCLCLLVSPYSWRLHALIPFHHVQWISIPSWKCGSIYTLYDSLS